MKHHPENYINRELSWLEFNQRVLDLAALDEIPLLERVKFLAITGSNLDEFVKVRVGGMWLAKEAGSDQREISGLTITEQLGAVNQRIDQMYRDQSRIFLDQLLPQLASNQICCCTSDSLRSGEVEFVERFFETEIASTVSPIAIERERSFPLLSGAKLCVAARIKADNARPAMRSSESAEGEEGERFVVVPIGGSLPRIVKLPTDSGFEFMFVESLIEDQLNQFFPNEDVLETAVFRITRNADIALEEDGMHDLLRETRDMLVERKISRIIRLEVSSAASEQMRGRLVELTGCPPDGLFLIDGPLNMSSLFELAGISGFPQLKDEPWPPQHSPDFAGDEDIFETIAASDRLLIHPYQSFDAVVDFLRAAAEDPQVIAIKQTLYRTSSDSEIIAALIEAAENSKQVTAIVELKARFDEARNIAGARNLEQAGADVIYGIEGLKTHAKVCLVVRRESRGLQRYVHFGTGNYNESTARIYSDVSLLTNDEQLGSDANLFFNAVTGLSVPQQLKQLAVAPVDLRETLLEHIHAETLHARSGGGAQITAKLNSLVDREIIDALYEASNAGVKIRLNIRGLCCLRPGVKGLSENIEVISIVDRFLEHARIIHFSQAGDDLIYISSADWMGRNLNRRAELLVPVEDEQCKRRLMAVLNCYFKDNCRASKLGSDGSYRRLSPGENARYQAQHKLYEEACDLLAAHSDPKATVFKAVRGERA